MFQRSQMIQLEFNRNATLRNQSDRLLEILNNPNSRIILAQNGHLLGIENKLVFVTFKEILESDSLSAKQSKAILQGLIYLGQTPNKDSMNNLSCHDYFVLHWDEHSATCNQLKNLLEKKQYSPIDIRKAALNSSDFEAMLLIYSKGLLNWHIKNTFCSCCGNPSDFSSAGHARKCRNQTCQQVHFPKIEPAVIFSIETQIEKKNSILLARQALWPEKRFSVVAGFSEVGETLEEAVKRESLEEVGLEVEKVEYVASQAWPFPASLMLAFKTETKQTNIRLVDKELEEAKWFNALALKQAVETQQVKLPFAFSVSWHLIDIWYQKETGQGLASLVKG